MKPHIKGCRSFPVTIFIAGEYRRAIKIAQQYCDDIGLCVTVEPTTYVYTGGLERGVKVGLINYPRFPSDPATILAKATELANKLREELNQESFSIQTPDATVWHSYRKEDANED